MTSTSRQKYILIAVALVSSLLFSSCAQKIVEIPPEIYWPLPPETPRIKFVDMIIGSKDIRKRDGSASMSSFLFGEGGEIKFIKPYGVAARKNKLYVTDIGGVFVFDFESGKFSILGSKELRLPSGIAVLDDSFFVADNARKKIFHYDLSGRLIKDFGSGEIDTVAGIAVDRQRKQLVVSDAKKNVVHIYDYDGRHLGQFGKRGKGNGEFNIPYGAAVDSSGRIYIVDSANFRIQIFDAGGVFIKSMGQVGSSAGNFARPKGIALDSEGHLYVLDSAFGNYQILDFDGNSLLAVGSTGTGPAEFQLPSSIFIDESDKIYVVDQFNARIQIFQYLKETQKR
jgi:DNA-binding beta-propeller fold protein YncE